MNEIKPYQRKLRKSLFISTILPAFILIIVGFATFYTVYRIIEVRSIVGNTEKIKNILENTNHDIKEKIEKERLKLTSLNPQEIKDITEIKRTFNNMIHGDNDTSIIYKLENQNIDISNNYENKKEEKMLLVYNETIRLKDGIYNIYFYIENQLFFNDLRYKKNQSLLIVDKYDNVLFSNFDRINYGGKIDLSSINYLFKREKLSYKENEVLVLKDMKEILEDGMKLFLIMLIIFIVLMVFGYFFSRKISKYQTLDIESIISNIELAKLRKLGEYESLATSSELEIINHYIYELFKSNEKLIHSIEVSEKSLRDIQLKEIESQFHPHFLFNTMQTIQYLILLSPKKATDVVQQLSDMLRYTLRIKADKVLIGDEIKYIKKYIAIQNVRFDNNIHLTIDIPKELKETKIDKMIIFPFIENAIKHNKNLEIIEIKIRISSRKNNLYILVQDNGKGMTQEKLIDVRNKMLISLYETKTLGLNHLNNKLILKYNRKSRIRIFSDIDKGTLTFFKLSLGGD